MGFVPPIVPPAFQAPTQESIEADPSYQFRLGQGRKALENSAAARGTLRSGGTLKDILEYGQNLGAQQYDTVYDRARSEYDRARSEYDADYDRKWREYVYATTPRGGGGGRDEFIPPPPEAPGGDPYFPEDDMGGGPGGPEGGPYSTEDPYGSYY